MRRWSPLALAALVLAGCVAETIERRKPRKGPVKEVGYVDFGGGRVRYSAEGWGWIVASRRRLAERLMARNCGKDLEPRVVDEYVRKDADATYAGEDVVASLSHGDEHYVVERYVHVAYECRPPGWVEPAVSTGPARAPVLVIPAVPAPRVDASTAAVAAPPAVSTTPAASAAGPSAAPSVPISSAPIPSPESPR